MADNAILGDVCVLVVGDVGRSPRMQYHTRSILPHARKVHLVGYQESPLINDLKLAQNLNVYDLGQFDLSGKSKWIKLILLPVKAIYLLFSILYVLLWKIKKMDIILVQNPPSIPTLFAAKIAALVHGSKFVIDWHNYGYSILELSLRKGHFLVRFSKWYEMVFGKLANAHFCVTKAMQSDLLNNWGIKAVVLYDKPPEFFKKSSSLEFVKLFQKLKDKDLLSDIEPVLSLTDFIHSDNGKDTLRNDRPALIVSSTSYTEDEDFHIMLEALRLFDLHINQNSFKVLVVITGKGPLFGYFKEKIKEHNSQMSHIRIIQVWLDPEDYPKLLGCSDIGISLHLSSSGRDLPMKIVDMYGAGLPVCAYSFPCLSELVQNGINGLTFSDAKELASNLENIFQGFTLKSATLKSLIDGVTKCSTYKTRWSENWTSTALPILQHT
jgi:beta-1,4-mannosyltransferase